MRTALHATPSQLIHGYPSAQRPRLDVRTYMYRAVQCTNVRMQEIPNLVLYVTGLCVLWRVKCSEAPGGETTKPFSIFAGYNSSFWCPERCVCSMQERIIDCSSLGLRTVPVLPQSTKRL